MRGWPALAIQRSLGSLSSGIWASQRSLLEDPGRPSSQAALLPRMKGSRSYLTVLWVFDWREVHLIYKSQTNASACLVWGLSCVTARSLHATIIGISKYSELNSMARRQQTFDGQSGNRGLQTCGLPTARPEHRERHD